MSASAIHEKPDLLALEPTTEGEPAARDVSGCPFHRVLGLDGRAARKAAATSPAATSPSVAERPRDLPAPPMPTYGAFRQTMRFAADPFNLLRQLRLEHGDLFALEILGLGKIVFLCSPELLQQMYRLDGDSVAAGEIRKKVLGRTISPLSNIAIDGEEYRRRRRITTPWFTGRRVDRFTPAIERIVCDEIETWTSGETIELQEAIDRISRLVITHVLFASVDRARLDRLERLASDFLVAFQWTTVQIKPLQRSFGPWSPWARFERRRARFESLIESLILERLAAGPVDEPLDLMTALIDSHRDRLEDGSPERAETVEMIVAELVSFVIGGTETTAKAAAWTMLGLLTHHDALPRLREELDEVLGQREMTPETIHKSLPYLDAVVQEGLRHQSVAPFAGPRTTCRSIALGGYWIESGTILAQCLSEAGQSELFPHAERFEPANFHGRDIKPNQWAPFGGGKRICAGMGLAQMEMAVIVGCLARFADLEVSGEGADHRPTKAGIAFRPKDNLRVRYRGTRTPAPSARLRTA